MTRERSTSVWKWEQMDVWKRRYEAYQRDVLWRERREDLFEERRLTQQAMRSFLRHFLDESLSLQEFNLHFQHYIHGEWSLFGPRGVEGLALHTLVKHAPPHGCLATLLRAVLPVMDATPNEALEGQQRMASLVRQLEAWIVTGEASRQQLQPGRMPFFLSAWWHVQAPERWPLFCGSVRRMLVPEEAERKAEWTPIDTYFLVRERFVALMHLLKCSSWEVEQVCCWLDERVSGKPQQEEARDEPLCEAYERFPSVGAMQLRGAWCVSEGRQTSRIHLQWLLAKLGQKVGCEVWVAPVDRAQTWQNERLGDLSLECLPSLPMGQQELAGVDLLWLHKTELVAAYRIAQTPEEMVLSLLHLYDLSLLLPKRDVAFCVVASDLNGACVQSVLSRPLFQKYGKRRRCGVLFRERLFEHEEHILRWASSPKVVIADLTRHVGTGA